MPTSAPHRDFCDPPPDCADWLADQQGFAGGSGSQTMSRCRSNWGARISERTARENDLSRAGGGRCPRREAGGPWAGRRLRSGRGRRRSAERPRRWRGRRFPAVRSRRSVRRGEAARRCSWDRGSGVAGAPEAGPASGRRDPEFRRGPFGRPRGPAGRHNGREPGGGLHSTTAPRPRAEMLGARERRSCGLGTFRGDPRCSCTLPQPQAAYKPAFRWTGAAWCDGLRTGSCDANGRGLGGDRTCSTRSSGTLAPPEALFSWNRGKPSTSPLGISVEDSPLSSPQGVQRGRVGMGILHVSPRMNARCVPRFHNKSASGEARSSAPGPGWPWDVGFEVAAACRPGRVQAIDSLQVCPARRRTRLSATHRHPPPRSSGTLGVRGEGGSGPA